MREHARFPPDPPPLSVYLIILSVAAALAAGFGVSLAGAGTILGVLAGLVAFVLCQVIVGRRLKKRLEPAMAQVQRQIEARMLRPALDTLKGLLPLGNWVPLLRGQLYAQMGMLAYHTNATDEARGYLMKASRRATEAQVLLAAMLDREGDFQGAKKVLERAAPYQKKSDLFFNVMAYILHKNDDTANALTRLSRFVEKQGGEVSKDNLSRLQNDRKLNMKPFGVQWFALGYERPPASMGQMQTGRKGFRQPPKSKR